MSTEPIVKPGPVVVKRKREGIQLCLVYEPGKKTNPKHFYMEPKFDGIRGIVIIRNNSAGQVTVEALTSTGLPVYNVGHIKDALAAAALANPQIVNNRVLDGEFLNPEIGFDATSGLCRKFTHDPAALGINFYVWDRLSLLQFDDKICNEPLWHRKSSLQEILFSIDHPQVIEVEYVKGTTHEEIVDTVARYKARGNEGIVIKDVDGLYEFRKSKAWLKWKPELENGQVKDAKEGDFTIVGAAEGRGKHAGRLGALMIRGSLQADGNISENLDGPAEQEISGEVGTGFNDEQRELFWGWHSVGALVGRVVEVKYQELSKDGSVRFPVFYRLREDKQ